MGNTCPWPILEKHFSLPSRATQGMVDSVLITAKHGCRTWPDSGGPACSGFPFLAPVVSFVDLLVGTDAKLVYWIL